MCNIAQHNVYIRQQMATCLHFVDDAPSVLDALDLDVRGSVGQQELVDDLQLAGLRVEFYGLQNHFCEIALKRSRRDVRRVELDANE